MALITNANNMEDVLFNGNKLQNIVCDGFLIFSTSGDDVNNYITDESVSILITKRNELGNIVEQKKVQTPYLSGISHDTMGNTLDGYPPVQEITVPAGTYILFEQDVHYGGNISVTNIEKNTTTLTTFTEDTTIKLAATGTSDALFGIVKVINVNSIGEPIGSVSVDSTTYNYGTIHPIISSAVKTFHISFPTLVANQTYLILIKFYGGNTQAGAYDLTFNDIRYHGSGSGDEGGVYNGQGMNKKDDNTMYVFSKNSSDVSNGVDIQYRCGSEDDGVRVSIHAIAIPILA